MAAATATAMLSVACGKGITDNANKKNSVAADSKEDNKPILVLTHEYTCPICGFAGNCFEIILSDEEKEKLPKLAEYIDDLNKEYKDLVDETVCTHGEIGEDGYCTGHFFSGSAIAEVKRADDKFVSIIVSCKFNGGAYPNYWSDLYNIDCATGKRLTISQVVDDEFMLTGAMRAQIKKDAPNIVEYLAEKNYSVCSYKSHDYFKEWDDISDFYLEGYGTETFGDNVDSKLKYTFAGDNDDFEINEKGLHFIIDEYDLGPHGQYVTGDITLKYSDYPELVKKKYIPNEAQDLSDIVEYKEVEETL